jgi:BMFP domain-containing protein YqiC
LTAGRRDYGMTDEEKEDLRLDIEVIREELERQQCILISAKEKLKRVDPLSDEFEATYNLIKDTKAKIEQFEIIRLRYRLRLRK